ncbi:hypothetical protein ACFX2B_026913 [Malus domestica]
MDRRRERAAREAGVRKLGVVSRRRRHRMPQQAAGGCHFFLGSFSLLNFIFLKVSKEWKSYVSSRLNFYFSSQYDACNSIFYKQYLAYSWNCLYCKKGIMQNMLYPHRVFFYLFQPPSNHLHYTSADAPYIIDLESMYLPQEPIWQLRKQTHQLQMGEPHADTWHFQSDHPMIFPSFSSAMEEEEEAKDNFGDPIFVVHARSAS